MSGISSASSEFPLYGREDETQQALLEQAADRLLLANQQERSPRSYPFHTENWMRRCCQRDGTQPAVLTEEMASVLSSARWCLRLLTRLELPTRWRLAFRLAIRGYTQREIARCFQVHPAQVSRWLKQVRAELREATRQYLAPLTRPEEIREVFRSEMERRGYTCERHCKRGQEACRKSGLCTRRWYLHYMSE